MPPQAQDDKKIKVLIIEDDVFMSDLLSKALTRAGFDTMSAKTGAEGIARFNEKKPDVILLDILLPDESGLEALRTIRRLPGGPEVKVIVLSNLSREANAEEAKRLGAAEYLVKVNFSLDEIIEKIRSVAAG